MELDEDEADLAIHVLDDGDAAAEGVEGEGTAAGGEAEEGAVGLALAGALEEGAPAEDVGAVAVEKGDGAIERNRRIEAEGDGEVVVDHLDLVRPLGGDERLRVAAFLEGVGEEDRVGVLDGDHARVLDAWGVAVMGKGY